MRRFKLGLFLKNRVVKNASWLIAGRIYHMLISFFVGLMTARYLGPSNFGLINYAATYTIFFASICTLGINSVIIKNFIDFPDEEGTTLGSALVLRIVSSLLSIIMILSISFIADRNEPQTFVVVALCSFSVLFQVFDTISFWFQSKLKSKYPAIASVISYTIVSAYKLWLLFTEKSVKWFAVSTSIDYLVVAIFLLFVYRKHNGPVFSFSKKKAKQLLSKSYHFILSGLMISIYGSTDKFMLKQMMSETEVGYYSTAVSVCNLWVFVLVAIIDSFYPVIIQSLQHSKVGFRQKNKQLYAITFYLSVSVSLFFTIFANLIIVTLYGSDYQLASMPLRIITWYTAFSYLGVARDVWIVSTNNQKFLKYIYVGAAATNVLLNTMLIPVWGASGAALASLLTQISTVFIFPFMIKEMRPNVKLMIEAILLKGLFPTTTLGDKNQ